MSRTNILRVRRTDATDSHLLVHIAQQGSKLLDLKLIGTEHTELYHGALKDSESKSLQASNYGGTLAEWKTVLRHVLLGSAATSSFSSSSGENDEAEGTQKDLLAGLELLAAIKSTTLTLTLRKNLPGGIAQRLGSITLTQATDSEEVSPFDWVDETVASNETLQTQLAAQKEELLARRAETAKLNARLDELIAAKREFERKLLAKCAALINAKKLKIRDQQRLLNMAKVHAGSVGAVGAARGKGRVRAEGDDVQGRGKRMKVEEAEAGDDEELPDVDEDGERSEATRQEETPPPPSQAGDMEVEVGDDEDETTAAFPAQDLRSGDMASSRQAESAEKMDADLAEELPPKRDLPFGRKAYKPPPEAPSAAKTAKGTVEDDEEDDDDDEESDDEL